MSKFPSLKRKKEEIDKLLLIFNIKDCMMSTNETLEYLIMKKRAEFLSKHEENHSIWYNENIGRWCTKLGKDRHQIRRKEREALENAIIEFYILEENLSATFEDAFNDLCQHMEDTGSHTMKTINEYGYDYRRTIAGSDFSKMPMNQITEKHLIHFIKEMVYNEEKLPRKRFNAAKTIIRKVFNHARLEMDIECISVKNVMDDLCFPSSAFQDNIIEDNSQVFKVSELKAIKKDLSMTNDLKELGILLALETGLRLGELCTLKREDISDTELKIRRSEHKAKFDDHYEYFIGAPKKNKTRNVILSKKAKTILTKILALHNSQWLFPANEDFNSWMRSYHFDKAIRQVCRRINIPERSMHKVRKTYSSYLLSQGVEEKVVQKQLGHSDIITTQKAYYYDIFDTNEKVRMLQDLEIG